MAGSATISSDGSHLAVDQASQAAILSWQSFSVGGHASAHFDNGSGVTLNRVTDNVPSSIDGLLTATGSLYLINPAGVTVGTGGHVATGGSFVVSTQDVSNEDFLNGGDLTFSGRSKASVINAGTIRSAQGNVALTARRVENAGTIEAPNGTATLAAGYQVLMRDKSGADGTFAVEVGGSDTEAVNTGTIEAAEAEMRANGGNVYALAGNTKSVIEATGVERSGGRIFLTAGSGGAVHVTGHLVARQRVKLPQAAPVPIPRPEDGGDIRISGGTVTLAGTINAAGRNGGVGGRISAIADGAMTANGMIRAGGSTGGFVETSGHTLDVEGATVDAGEGGKWLLDPYDLTVDTAAASTIDTSLGAGTSVTLKTTATGTSGPGTANASGSGDIIIDAPLSWGTGATLTLDAYHSISIDAPITVSGAGGVGLVTNDGGTGGDWDFGLGATGFAGSIDYGSTDNGGSFSTDSDGTFTLVYSMSDLAGINTALGGNYALATSLDASSLTLAMPFGVDSSGNVQNSGNGFTGIFDGLGHTITGLTVDTGSNDYAGLFGYSSGTLRDVGLVGGSVSGGNEVGGLVGQNNGTVTNAYATGTVTGGASVGGLVGQSPDPVSTINGSYATGSVSGTYSVGGLVGYAFASIADSYATGTVSGHFYVGGLVGYNSAGTITQAYATGQVTGDLNSDFVGGLVGLSNGASTITDAYATGSVTGGGAGHDVGGLVGSIAGTTVTNAYATGVVTGIGLGGLVGTNLGGTITNGYWDTETSGTTTSGGGTGKTTAELSSALPNGFDASVWGNVGNQTTPYLLNLPGPFYIGSDSAHLFQPITDVQQLQMINDGLSGNYALIDDIDASATAGWNSGAGFVPLGSSGNGFTGIFDGLGHAISDLTVNRPSARDVGLFGFIDDATIRDVGLKGGTVSGQYNVGMLAGYVTAGTVANSYASGDVNG